MFKAFSGSCLSLDDAIERSPCPRIQKPRVLGPGVDEFLLDGCPAAPQLSVHAIPKGFSGSALDLANDTNTPPPAPIPMSNGKQLFSPMDLSPASSAPGKMSVLVTAAQSFVGAHIVRELLQAEYTVHALVCSTENKDDVRSLFRMGPLSRRRLFVYDEVHLKNALSDVSVVIYVPSAGVANENGDATTAEHYVKQVSDLFRAVRVYGSCVRSVIVIGTAAAIYTSCIVADRTRDQTVSLEQTNDPVVTAKVAALHEAQRQSVTSGIPIVVLLPSVMLGPCLTQDVPDAVVNIQRFALHSSWFPFVPGIYWNYVDVRDVAAACRRLLELPSDKTLGKRFILNCKELSFAEICISIKRQFPALSPPTVTAPHWLTLLIAAFPYLAGQLTFDSLLRRLDRRTNFENKKAREELGISFTPMDQTIRETIVSVLQIPELELSERPTQSSWVRRVVIAGFAASVAGVLLLRFRSRAQVTSNSVSVLF